MSQTPGKMGRFDVKKEEKAPLDAKKEGKDSVSVTPLGGKISLVQAKH